MHQKIHRKLFFFQNAISNNFQFSELKQIQNEKRRLLVETETEKLKSLDESFKKKFEHWRDKLGPRKQVSPVTSYFSKHYFFEYLLGSGKFCRNFCDNEFSLKLTMVKTP